MRCLFVFVAVVLLASCSSYAPEPREAPRPPAPLADELPTISQAAAFDPCPGPVPASLEIDCWADDVRAWRMSLAGHDVFAAITRTKGETTWKQRRVAIDGVRFVELPPAYSFLDDLGRLELAERDAHALLELLAVTGLGRPAPELSWTTALTRQETYDIVLLGAEATRLVADKLPGFGHDDDGWHLRVYTYSAQAHAVSRVELSVIDGEVVLHPVVTRIVER